MKRLYPGHHFPFSRRGSLFNHRFFIHMINQFICRKSWIFYKHYLWITSILSYTSFQPPKRRIDSSIAHRVVKKVKCIQRWNWFKNFLNRITRYYDMFKVWRKWNHGVLLFQVIQIPSIIFFTFDRSYFPISFNFQFKVPQFQKM